MRSNLSLSLAAWTTAALTALSFAACAKAVNGDLYDVPTSGANADSGASTQQGSGSDDGGGSSPIGTPNPGTGDDSGSTSSNDDSGSTSSGDDSGGSSQPDSGSSSGGQDSGGNQPTGGGAQPQSVCPTTSYYTDEFDNAGFGSTLCYGGSDCSTSQCCYLVALLGDGFCVGL